MILTIEVASMIQAGLVAPDEKVEENRQNIAANKKAISVNEASIAANKARISANEEEVSKRFSDLADYDVKDEAVVYFASRKSAIAQKDKGCSVQMPLSILATSSK